MDRQSVSTVSDRPLTGDAASLEAGGRHQRVHTRADDADYKEVASDSGVSYGTEDRSSSCNIAAANGHRNHRMKSNADAHQLQDTGVDGGEVTNDTHPADDQSSQQSQQGGSLDGGYAPKRFNWSQNQYQDAIRLQQQGEYVEGPDGLPPIPPGIIDWILKGQPDPSKQATSRSYGSAVDSYGSSSRYTQRCGSAHGDDNADPRWFYLDPMGRIQGPITADSMIRWVKSRYLLSSTQVFSTALLPHPTWKPAKTTFQSLDQLAKDAMQLWHKQQREQAAGQKHAVDDQSAVDLQSAVDQSAVGDHSDQAGVEGEADSIRNDDASHRLSSEADGDMQVEHGKAPRTERIASAAVPGEADAAEGVAGDDDSDEPSAHGVGIVQDDLLAQSGLHHQGQWSAKRQVTYEPNSDRVADEVGKVLTVRIITESQSESVQLQIIVASPE